MKTSHTKIALFTFLLAACLPVTQIPSTATPVQTESDTAEPGHPVTAPVVTVIVSTAAPGLIASLPANLTPAPSLTAVPATPIPTLPSGSSPTLLKYLILDQFPDFFYCDPDLYPVAFDDEIGLAQGIFPTLQANTETFEAILARNGLTGVTTFNDDQKLLIYREYKKLAAIRFDLAMEAYRFQLQIADTSGQGFFIQGQIDGTGSILIESREPNIAGCPICLAAHTKIDTPRGPVDVEDLQVGDLVWTADETGARQLAIVLKTGHTAIPAHHQMVHLILDDGRELWASPGHPLPRKLALQDLQIGDLLDGAIVINLEREPPRGAATYDLLPSGPTGYYWANGILVGSTFGTYP